MKTEDRYILSGDRGGWDSYIITSDDITALEQEARIRLVQGYSAFIYDRKYDIQYTLRIRTTE